MNGYDRSSTLPLLSLLSLLLLLGGGGPGCDREEPEGGERRDGSIGTEQSEREVRGEGQEGDSTAIPYRTPEGEPARFAFRSGAVDMEYVGIMNGTRRLRFDRYGLREQTWDSAFPAADRVPLTPIFSTIIMTPESYSVLDMRTREGRFGANETIGNYRRAWQQSNRPLGELVLDASGGERLPDTLLLGRYPSRVYRQVGQDGTVRTIYVHGGVPIGEAVTFGNDPNTGYRILPRRVEFDVELPDSHFTVPSDYRMLPFGSSGGR